jgi:energy-converting hydrogenase Eha subunit C
MIELISKRDNLSAPGLDGITFPYLKLEKESAAELIIEMIRFMIIKRRISKIWKTGKIILIFKGGEATNQGNWRPITLVSIIYNIVFGRISQVILDFESRPKRIILSMAQKGFVTRINGCGEQIAIANMAINPAMTSRNILYMMALDMRDEFGSVSHKQLENNFRHIGL